MTTLVLFDVDQTLLCTGGAGLAALRLAFREVFALPPDTPIDLDLAGATDTGILRDFLSQHGLPEDRRMVELFFRTYLAALEDALIGSEGGRVLPGVIDLLAGLADFPAVAGLLTGNLRRGAELKLRHFGLDGFFDTRCGAYGDDHPERDRLGPVALRRANEIHRLSLVPAQVVVVGDTPRDIRCARALGARAVAVATGKFPLQALRACEPDALFPDLSDTSAVIGFLTRGRRAPG